MGVTARVPSDLVFGPSVAVGFAGLVLGGLGWFLVRVIWRHGRIPFAYDEHVDCIGYA